MHAKHCIQDQHWGSPVLVTAGDLCQPAGILKRWRAQLLLASPFKSRATALLYRRLDCGRSTADFTAPRPRTASTCMLAHGWEFDSLRKDAVVCRSCTVPAKSSPSGPSRSSITCMSLALLASLLLSSVFKNPSRCDQHQIIMEPAMRLDRKTATSIQASVAPKFGTYVLILDSLAAHQRS